MSCVGIRDHVEGFLTLVRQGAGSQQQNEAYLTRLLDELALARHEVGFVFDETDHPDPPDWPYKERRAVVCERFPNYGMYNVALSVSVQPDQAELGLGDAIDDIAGELSAVAWAWNTTSEADALWRFEHSFNSHWGQHLRDLQQYLHALKSGS